jgi:hypothetical protein
MPVTSSAPIALRYSVSIRPWAHAKLIQQNVLRVTSTESKSSNTASLVVLPAADHRQTPLPRIRQKFVAPAMGIAKSFDQDRARVGAHRASVDM